MGTSCEGLKCLFRRLGSSPFSFINEIFEYFDVEFGPGEFEDPWQQRDDAARWNWSSPVEDCVIVRTHGNSNQLTDVTRKGSTGFDLISAFAVKSIADGEVLAIDTTTRADGEINYLAIFDKASLSTIYYMHVSGGTTLGGRPLLKGDEVTAGSVIGSTDRSGEVLPKIRTGR